jgi:hypothetical protein
MGSNSKTPIDMKLFSKNNMHELTLPKMLELLQNIIYKAGIKRGKKVQKLVKGLNQKSVSCVVDNTIKIKLEDKFISYNSLNIKFSLDQWKDFYKMEFDNLKHTWRISVFYENEHFLFKFRKNAFWEQYSNEDKDDVKEQDKWILSSKYNIIYNEFGIANNFIDR